MFRDEEYGRDSLYPAVGKKLCIKKKRELFIFHFVLCSLLR